MGSIIGSHMKSVMEENMKKSQEFMMATQRQQMERQMTMQQAMQQKQMAMQIARNRELFNWYASFAATASVFLTLGAIKKKNPALLAPVLPIGFVVGYQYDAVYGDKLMRIRDDAEMLIKEHSNLLDLPDGTLTFDKVEKIRLQNK